MFDSSKSTDYYTMYKCIATPLQNGFKRPMYIILYPIMRQFSLHELLKTSDCVNPNFYLKREISVWQYNWCDEGPYVYGTAEPG